VDTSPYGWASGESITTRVQVSDGIFNLKIVDLSSMDFDSDSLYVEVSFDDTVDGGDSINETFSPRKRLDSTPYAFRAKYTEIAGNVLWSRSGTIVSPINSGDDVRLGAGEQLQFGDTGQITYEYSGSVLGISTGDNDISFDSNTLFVDGSESLVGIGTDSPEVNLDIVNQTTNTSTSDDILKLTNISSTTYTSGFGTSLAFSIDDSNDYEINSGKLEFVAAQDTGVDSGFNLYTVVGESYDKRIEINRGANMTINPRDDGGDSVYALTIRPARWGKASIGGVDENGYEYYSLSYASGGGVLNLADQSSTRINLSAGQNSFIDPDGDLAIGHTSPEERTKLDIENNISTTHYSSKGLKTRVYGTTDTRFHGPQASYGGYIVNEVNKATAIGADDDFTNVGLYVSSDGTADYNYGLIVENGSVGIGTTAPTTDLHVAGDARITGLSSCDLVYTDANGNLQCGTNEGAVWEAYDNTGGQDISSTVTVNLDQERQTNSNYTLTSDEVAVGSAGVYETTFTCSIDVTSGSGNSTGKCWIETDTGSGFSVVDGTECYTYNNDSTQGENSCTRTVVLDLSSGDDVRLRAERNAGTDTLETITDGSSLTMKKMISSGADLAEIYYTYDEEVEAGDVVSIDEELEFGVQKASNQKDNVSNSLGVVATHPKLVMGDIDKEHKGRAVLVALAGRVPVKIDPDSEDIDYGDYLMVSPKEGLVKKADDIGMVVGKALESWEKQPKEKQSLMGMDGEIVEDIDKEKVEEDTVTMLVQNIWYSPEEYTTDLKKLLSDYRGGSLGGSGGSLASGWVFEGNSISTSSDVITSSLTSTIGTFSILDTRNLSVGDDKFIADSRGNLDLAGDIVLAGYIGGRYGDVKVRLGDAEGRDKFVIANSDKEEVFSVDSRGGVRVIDGEDASTGFGTIGSGAKSTVVRTSQVGTKPKIYITFNGDYYPATRYWVTDIREGRSFKVVLDAPTNRKVDFNWWIVNAVE
jgi:hypothetical protein